jgi:hypothetical protein
MTDDEITGEIKRVVASDAQRVVRKDAYFWVVMILTSLLGSGVSIYISRQGTEASERKLCKVVISADDRYRSAPPSSTTIKTQAANMADLRKELGCPPYQNEEIR